MKIKTLTVNIEATINLGDYQNIKPHYTVEAEIEADDDIEACRQQLSDTVHNWLLADAQRTLQRKVKPILPLVEGLGANAQAQLKNALPALAMVIALDDSLPLEAVPEPPAPRPSFSQTKRVDGKRPKPPFDRIKETPDGYDLPVDDTSGK